MIRRLNLDPYLDEKYSGTFYQTFAIGYKNFDSMVFVLMASRQCSTIRMELVNNTICLLLTKKQIDLS